MPGFSGSEPLVGEVVGVRTFRVEAGGRLLPLYSDGCWYDGVNTAECTPPTGDTRGHAHPVPDPACECGFYAYAGPEVASRSWQSRHVRAVVSCWGGVVAGTLGVRAQYARIDAIWLHPDAPAWLRGRVARRYPSARLYADADAMLAEHPLSQLPCYGPPARRPVVRPALTALAVAMVLALGLLPYEWLAQTGGLRELWYAAVAGSALFALWLLLGARGIGHWSAAVVVVGTCAWLVAPAFGLFGWLLRLPVLRALLVAAAGALLALRPHHFPLVRPPRERTFAGVRG